MITGIGTDIVEVARFIPWVNAPQTRLRSIFSEQEINDCFTLHESQTQQVAERLAARFTAKEAFYKALTATLVTLNRLPAQPFSFIFAAQHVTITTGQLGAPIIVVDWQPFNEKIGTPLPPLTINLSLTHEKKNALAFVVISL